MGSCYDIFRITIDFISFQSLHAHKSPIKPLTRNGTPRSHNIQRPIPLRFELMLKNVYKSRSERIYKLEYLRN